MITTTKQSMITLKPIPSSIGTSGAATTPPSAASPEPSANTAVRTRATSTPSVWAISESELAARITMPKSYVRLSAGRESMSEELQALCFFAGANSIFYCEKLLTTMNAGTNRDVAMFEKLGLTAI
mgnify:CR=1 FL=1